MAITTQQPTTTLTVAQRGVLKRQRIIQANTRLLKLIVDTVQANMAEVWEDPDQTNFSPQQVFALFAPADQGALVTNAAALVAIANAQVANSLPANAPKTLTIGPDGTVTVGS